MISGFAAPAAAVDEPSPDETEDVDSRSSGSIVPSPDESEDVDCRSSDSIVPSPDESEDVDSRSSDSIVPMDRVLISNVYLAALKLCQRVRVHLTGTEPCGKGKLTDASTLILRYFSSQVVFCRVQTNLSIYLPAHQYGAVWKRKLTDAFDTLMLCTLVCYVLTVCANNFGSLCSDCMGNRHWFFLCVNCSDKRIPVCRAAGANTRVLL